MKGVIKTIIAGAVILGIGVGLLIVGLSVNGWSFETNVEFETLSYTAEQDNTALDIEIDAGTLKTEYYDGEKIYVEYPVAKNYSTDVYEKDGTFFLENNFRAFFFILGIPKIPETVIKLPRDAIFDLRIDMDAGTLNIARGQFGSVELDMSAGTLNSNGFDCSSLKLKISAGSMYTGNINCNSLVMDMSAGSAQIDALTCADTKIKISAGDAKFGYTGNREEYRISTSVSAGSCNVASQEGNTDKVIDVRVSAGSVKFDFGA